MSEGIEAEIGEVEVRRGVAPEGVQAVASIEAKVGTEVVAGTVLGVAVETENEEMIGKNGRKKSSKYSYLIHW